MKISELKNAPEWLVLADTVNADVDITSYGRIIWNSGNFRGGDFLGGNFRGGVMAPTCKWVYGITPDGKIRIGRKEMSIKEWDKWFKSNEEFSTKRDTIAFKKIAFCYKTAKAYLKEFTDKGELKIQG